MNQHKKQLALLLLGLAVMAGACGGKETEESKRSGQAAEVDREWLVPNAAPVENVLLVAVDGLRLGGWPKEIYPHLARLMREGRAFPNHVATSTGSHSQMATLLTGLEPLQHGVGSIHDRGRTFLDPEAETLAKVAKAQGATTFASVAVPQFGPQIGGFERGFDTFLAPSVLAEAIRPIDRVDMVMQEAWATALGDDAPFMGLVHLADMTEPSLPATENVQASVGKALDALVPQYPGLARAAHEARQGPEAFDGVRKTLMRQRGSAVYQAFVEAVYTGQLADIDIVLGRWMGDLEQSKRIDDTAIVFVSLRGSILGPPTSEGAMFPPEVVRCPLVIWAPERIRPGLDGSLISTALINERIRGLAGWLEQSEPTQVSVVEVRDAPFARRALFTSDLHWEENVAAGMAAFDRLGKAVLRPEALGASEASQWAELEKDWAQDGTKFGYRLEFDWPEGVEVRVRWRTVHGRYRDAVGSNPDQVNISRRSAMRGLATLRGKGWLEIETYLREQPVVMEWSGAPSSPGPSTKPRLWVVDEKALGESLEDPVLGLMRDSGVWTRAIVQGEAGRDLRMFCGLVSEQQNLVRTETVLESTPLPQVGTQLLPGRSDGMLLGGQTPINVQFKEPPSNALVLALHLEETWVSPMRFALDGTALWPAGQAKIYIPDWWPGVTDDLEEGWELVPGLRLQRLGPLAGKHLLLHPDAAEFVGNLGRGE